MERNIPLDIAPAVAKSSVEIAEIDIGNCYVGSNLFSVQVDNPERRALVVDLAVTRDAAVSHSELASDEEHIEHRLPYTITGQKVENLGFECTVAEGGRPLTKRTKSVYVVPFTKELDDVGGMLADLDGLLDRVVNRAGLEERIRFLESKLPGFRERIAVAGTMTEVDRRAFRDAFAAFREEVAALLPLARAAATLIAPDSPPILLFAANPWAPFGPAAEIVDDQNPATPVAVEAFHGEVEAAAVNVFNLDNRPRTFRITLGPIESAAEDGKTVPAGRVVALHEVVEVPTEKLDVSADALPAVNQGNLLAVPAWGARQLWFEVDTAALTPGEWRMAVELRSIEVDAPAVSTELMITVWEPGLPKEQPLRLCHWGYVHSSVLKDQPEAALEDQVSHGTNVFVGLFYPQATYDENGELTGEIDFTGHDAYVNAHAPHGMILFCGYQGALTGASPHLSEAYRKAHVASLRAWVAHLATLGVGYEDFALYPIDEPGLTDGLVERYIDYATLAREADPRIRMYTDPVARITMEELERMAPYVDIWCPNRNGFLLEEGRDKLAFIQSTGKTVWTYECMGDVKHQSPLGYYRGQAWLVWRHGLTGIGFWSYCTSQDDPWYRPQNRQEYLLIYQGQGVVSSKRWEAVRDGVEDYSMLTVLRQAVERAEARNAAPETVKEARRLLTEGAAGIGGFCGAVTVPGKGGLPEARRLADEQWTQLREIRRKIAVLLAELPRE